MAYTDKQFLETIKPMVIADMKNTRILASLTAAQAFIESNKGNSGLTTKANNLFGMKGTYNGAYVTMKTKEFVGGKYITVDAKFRKYPSWAESIADHSALFNRLSRYQNLRGETNYKNACINVQKDGYATSPTYSSTLISCIEKYSLFTWDTLSVDDGLIDLDIKPTLRKGDRNEFVRAWQILLNSNGYACGKADGIFGDKTEAALIRWQQNHGIEAGYVGELTWDTI